MKHHGVGGVVFLAACSVWAADPPALDTVTVTARGDEVGERREATTQKVVLQRQDIERLGVMTIGEVLGKLPGVEIAGDGQRARGMARDSVQILVDGERTAGGARIAAAVLGRLPAGDLERIEILRGASAEHGGGAAVTVNLIMKKAAPKRSVALKAAFGFRGQEPTAQFTLTNNGGEGGYAWTWPITFNLHRAPVGATTERQGSAVVATRDEESGVSSFRELVSAPRFSWKTGGDALTLAPLLFDGQGRRSSSMTQFSAAGFNGDRTSSGAFQRRMVRLRIDGEKLAESAKYTVRASFSNGKRTTDISRLVRNAALVATLAGEHSTSHENEINLALRQDRPLEDHLLAVGLEYINLRRSDDKVFTGGYAVATSAQAGEQQSVVWVQDDWTVSPATTLTYGLRVERVVLDASGVAQRDAEVMPSLAVRWEPVNHWVLRSSIGAGLKMPKLEEIAATVSPSIGANTPLEADQRGNPFLRPERSVNLEAILERYLEGEMGVLGANFYLRSTRDFTERQVSFNGTNARWEEKPENQGHAVHWGIELDGKVRTDNLGWQGATVKAHLTLPGARVQDTRLGITRMARDVPVYVFSMGLDQSLPGLRSAYGVTMQVSGRSITDIPGEQRGFTQAKTTLDMFWLYKINAQFNLRVTGQNLLAADTVRETTWMMGGNSWQLRSVEKGYRGILAALEGRW